LEEIEAHLGPGVMRLTHDCQVKSKSNTQSCILKIPTLHPKLQTKNPEPLIVVPDSDSQKRNPKPRTLNPTLNPKPETLNPKP